MQDINRRKYRNAVLTGLLAVMMVCGGCTRKEELVLSLQNAQQSVQTTEESEELAGEGNASDAQKDTVFAMEGGTPEAIAAAGGNSAASASDEDGQTEARQSEAQEICVHVCGAVKNPGVYELPAGSRVYEAVQAAGGFAENADRDYVNQAQQLPDAVQLVIPTVEQAGVLPRIGILAQDSAGYQESPGTQAEGHEGSGAVSADGRININTASEEQLCEIPGVGAARAAAIAAYRREHGDFSSIEDIMKVSGIKQGAYAKMKDSITVN